MLVIRKLVYRFDFQEYNESNTAYSIVRTFNSNGYKKVHSKYGQGSWEATKETNLLHMSMAMKFCFCNRQMQSYKNNFY